MPIINSCKREQIIPQKELFSTVFNVNEFPLFHYTLLCILYQFYIILLLGIKIKEKILIWKMDRWEEEWEKHN